MKYLVSLDRQGDMWIEDLDNGWVFVHNDIASAWQSLNIDERLYKLDIFKTNDESDLKKYKEHYTWTDKLKTHLFDREIATRKKLDQLNLVAEKARCALDACWQISANDGLMELDELHQALVPITKWVAK